MATVRTKRVYDPRAASDGTRILVMRFWPRGIRRGHVDEWNRDVAPSRALLFAFKRGGLAWAAFAKRYLAELRPEALDALRARTGTVTLLCGCADGTRCHRTLLKRALSNRRRASSGSRARAARPPGRRGGRPGSRS